MDETDQEVARLLEPLRGDEPSAAPAVDIGRAMRVGRRTRRVRTGFGVAAAAVVVLLAVGFIPSVVRDLTRVDVAAGQFDVLRRTFGIGSAGGFTPLSYETGRYQQQVQLGLEKPAAGQSGQGTVTMYAKGRLHPAGDPAPDVYGHRAIWMSGTELAWEWDKDSWVVASLSGGFPDLRDRVYRVAESVSLNENSPITVPFTVPRDTGQLVGVRVPFGTGPSVLMFDALSVSVQSGLRPGPDHPANAQIGGHSASVGDHSVTVFDVGENLAVVADGSAGITRLTEVAGSVRLVANPTDRTTWVSDPLR